jgi:hypothetical protein
VTLSTLRATGARLPVASEAEREKPTRLPDLRPYSGGRRGADNGGVSRGQEESPVTWIGYLMSTLLCVYLMWMCWYLAKEHS